MNELFDDQKESRPNTEMNVFETIEFEGTLSQMLRHPHIKLSHKDKRVNVFRGKKKFNKKKPQI
jgi:hypothetical protein